MCESIAMSRRGCRIVESVHSTSWMQLPPNLKRLELVYPGARHQRSESQASAYKRLRADSIPPQNVIHAWLWWYAICEFISTSQIKRKLLMNILTVHPPNAPEQPATLRLRSRYGSSASTPSDQSLIINTITAGHRSSANSICSKAKRFE